MLNFVCMVYFWHLRGYLLREAKVTSSPVSLTGCCPRVHANSATTYPFTRTLDLHYYFTHQRLRVRQLRGKHVRKRVFRVRLFLIDGALSVQQILEAG